MNLAVDKRPKWQYGEPLNKEKTLGIEITVKTKRGAKGGKSHKLDRSYKNRLSGKPARQRERTAANKKKNIARNKANGDVNAGVSVPSTHKKHKK